jgi:DNA (cytosine-5)-methyltransferase 1
VEKMKAMYPEAKVVLWASLECTNFSKAKGGLPRDADSRTLADHLFPYIEALRPDYIQIENVEEFMSWGPLDENGKPISKTSGSDYAKWVNSVKCYGYRFQYKILNAADFGAFTTRKRFFGQFASHGLEIYWPEQTHAENPQNNLFGKQLKKWRAVREVLNFDDEGESIFDRKKPLVDATHERIYSGLLRFVAGGEKAFLVKYNSMSQTKKYVAPSLDNPSPVVSCQGRIGIGSVHFLSKYYSGHPESKNISIDGPAGAITTKDHHSFVSCYYGNGANVSSIENPCPTLRTKDTAALVQTRFIDQQFGQSKPASVDNPVGAITTNPKYSLATIKPLATSGWVMNTNFRNIGSSIDEPAQTITANRKWHYLMNPQFSSAGGNIEKPCFTLIARMDKRPPYIISTCSESKKKPSFICTEDGVFIYEIYSTDSPIMVKIKEFMAMYGIVDILMRMLRILELKKIMGFPENYILIGTQSEQKKYIGNAVEVTMSTVLCEALAAGLVELYEMKIAI